MRTKGRDDERTGRQTAAKEAEPAEAAAPQPPLVRLQKTHGNAFVQRLLAQRAGTAPVGEAPREVEEGIRAARGGGAPLPAAARGEMETAFGADFGGVRLHADARADALSRQIGARAFTVGADVFFRSGERERGGRELLAHELAHVVQQGGRAAQVQGKLEVGAPGDALEREADRAADAVVRAPAGGVQQGAAAVTGRGGPAVQRWESPEHAYLGDQSEGAATPLLVLDAHRRDLPGHRGPVSTWPDEWQRLWRAGDVDQKRVLGLGLTYGEVVALSGDLYGSIEALERAPLREIYDLIPLVRRHASTAEFQAATAGRYLHLAQQNERHFSNTRPGQSNLETWRHHHLRAIRHAMGGHAQRAWALNAFGDHFLTDAFAAGHVRVPRSELMGSTRDHVRSKILHDLDNSYGVAVHNPRGERWIAYGDDQMFKSGEPNPKNAANLALVKEAVRLSKQDVADALAQGRAYQVPARFAAEALIPEAVDPKQDRWPGRYNKPRVSYGPSRMRRHEPNAYTARRNELIVSYAGDAGDFVAGGDNFVRAWVAKHSTAAIECVPREEKVRMLDEVLGGNLSPEDVKAAEKIILSITDEEERTYVRNAIWHRVSVYPQHIKARDRDNWPMLWRLRAQLRGENPPPGPPPLR